MNITPRRVVLARTAGLSAAALAATALLAGCTPDAGGTPAAGGDCEPIELDLGHVLAEQSPSHEAALAMVDRIAERSDGGITIRLFPNSQLGSTPQTDEQAMAGANTITFTDASYASDYGVPEMGAMFIPFFWDDVDALLTFVESDLFDGWADQLADNGLKVLAPNWYFGDRYIIGNAAYEEPGDLSGVQIRTPAATTWVTTFEMLDAVPQSLAFSEVYSAMEQGVVDAAEAPASTLYDAGLYEVGSDLSLTSHFRQVQMMAMSTEVFDSLCTDYQDILIEEFHKGGEEATQLTIASQDEYVGKFEEEGIAVHEVDAAAYRDAVAGFAENYPEWPADLPERMLEAAGVSQ